MPYLLQVDFKSDGPFGEEMTGAYTDLAKSINEEPGLIWKIWTESSEHKEAGGIYLFETKENAENYKEMHSKRLAGFGISTINAKVFSVNSKLSEINHGPLSK